MQKAYLIDNKKPFYILQFNYLTQGKTMKNRITIGMHRMGLVASVVLVILSWIKVSDRADPTILTYMGSVVIGAVLYGLFRSAAWIINGFMKD